MDAHEPFDLLQMDSSRDRRERWPLSAMPRFARDAGEDRPPEDVAQGGAPYELSVRAVRLLDLPELARPPEFILLNEPRIGSPSYSALGAALSAIAPGWGRPMIFVAKSNGRLVGFAHFRQSGADRRWHGIAIGAGTGVYGPEPAWEALLRHATIAAGLQGVKRVFAKAPSGTAILQSFRRVNYSAYATETVFVTHHPVLGGPDAPVRRQEASDAWAIHQLYNAATPKQVQYAEAFTSDRWQLRHSRKGRQVSAWILEEGNIVIGFVRVASVGEDHRVEVLHHPGRSGTAKELVACALATLGRTARVDRIVCAVRGYQAEVATALEEHGFDPVMEQDLLITHTTAVARVALNEGMAFPAELIERLPKRAPSFPFGASVGDQS